MPLLLDRIPSPVGDLLVVFEGETLRGVAFEEQSPLQPDLPQATSPAAIRSRIEAYFSGDLLALDQIQVHPEGTAFQKQVWAALREIPAGTTLSYGQLAHRIGRPGASRAVGLANGSNPIGIVVPCHRVIGANGTLTGYGGGLHRKRWLLQHEGALPMSL